MLRLPIAVIQLMHHQKACKWLQLVTIGVSLILPSSLARAQTFGIYRQLWTGLSTTDGSINALTNTLQNPNWPNNPNSAYTQIFTDFETEFNFLEGYGQRLRAFVVPPTTGYYTFWISSADNSSLFLSTDEGVTNRQLLCYVVNSTNPREWNKELNQMSSPVALEGGRRYYLEVLHKEANGGDNLAVRWQLPNGVMEEPLTSSSPSGTLLIPCNGTNTLPGIYVQPADTTVFEQGNASFSLLVTNWVSVAYQWKLNGTNLSTNFSRKSFLTVSNVSMAVNNGQVYSCAVSTPSGSITSVVATLTVVADTNPPTLLSANVVGQTTVAVGFSEPIEVASATNSTNYSLSGALVVSAAALVDARTVWLTVSPVTYGSNYVLTVNNLRDRASAPNTIATDSQIAFTAMPYSAVAVGGAAPAGTVTVLTNGYDIIGGGNDIGPIPDQFQFAYQLLSGDFDMQVRLQGLTRADVWTKAGLLARETLTPNSRFAGTLATPSIAGEFFEYRTTTNGAPVNLGSFPPNYPFTWLRLQRAGNLFTGYASYDGQTWAVLGAVTLTMSNSLYFGMAVASHVNGAGVLAQFRDLGPTPPSAGVGVIVNPNEPLATSSRKTALVISEIMYKPAPRTDGRNLEYIEIYNANPYFFDMSGWQLTGGSISFTFPTPTIIPGDSFMVIAASPSDIQSIYHLSGVLGPYSGSLKKSGLIQLIDEVGAVRLEIPYSNIYPWPVAADGTGHSIVLARPSYGEGDPHAWDISDVAGGSPGTFEAFRASPLRNVVINELLAHTEDVTVPDYLELYNHSNQTNDLSGCVLTDNAATNKFIIPPGTFIAPRGFLVFYQTDLGFGLNAAGETVFFKNPGGSRILDAVQFEAQADGVSLGRWPDGADAFYPMAARTPGSANGKILVGDIVINELMYDPISGNDDDQYIELYNKGTNSVNLEGWKFTSGVTFLMPPNTWLDPDSYLVVARNAANLFSKYPNLSADNTVGDYSGKLSHNGDRLALAMPQPLTQTNNLGQFVTNTIYVVEDEVTYVSGGRWGQWSSGGGSSMELIDPRSNHRLPSNWADSDDTAKSQWVNIENTGTLDNGQGAMAFAQIGLLDAGECLVDNIEVHRGDGPNLVLNSDFENGLGNWYMEGCFAKSTLETNNAGYLSRSALHLRCSDRLWTGANSAEMRLASSLSSGTGTLRFKARWLHGWPEALLRLYGNYLEATGALPVPSNLGTPGQRNSRALANSPPAIYQITHSPAVPATNQTVTVSARLHDPDGIQALTLFYRVDPSLVYINVAMNDAGINGDAVAGDGLFSANIPGQPANGMVDFYIAAKDNLGASNTFPALINEFGSIHEGVIRFGDPAPTSTFGTYHCWISTLNVNRWAGLPNLSNESHDSTFVYNGRVIYNSAGRFSGSPYHQGFDTPFGSLCHYKWTFPEDDKLFGATSFNKFHCPGNGAGDDTSIQREQLSHTFLRTLGVPWLNRKYVNMIVNGVRRGNTGRELMEDAQTPDGDVVKEYWPNDSGGFLYKMQPWFEFTSPAITTPGIGNNNESWCNVMPYLTTGGSKKLARYRYNFLMRRTPDSASNYKNVFSLVDAASSFGTPNYTANMTNIADMENFMRVGAANHAAGNWDAYLAQNSQNLYGYIGTKGTRYSLLMWDYNIVIGNSGSWGPGVNLFVGNNQDPNTQNFYNNPTFRRAYLRALQELVEGPLEVSKSGPLIDAKYAAFKANGFTTAEDPNGFGPNGIKGWLAQAQAFIARTNALESTTTFNILTPNLNVDSNSVTLTGTAPLQVMSVTINGEPWPITWTSVKAWSITLPINRGTNALIVQGYDRFGKFISGTSNSITVVSTPPPLDDPVGKVIINEIMFNPLDPQGQFVELYNGSTTTSFEISGWVFNGLGYTFPPGSFLAPQSFLVLVKNRAAFASSYGATNLAFDVFPGNLQTDGETLTLIKPGPPETVIDKVRYQIAAPWPRGTNGLPTASSIQVIDPLQDNSRPCNWSTLYVPPVSIDPTNIVGSTNFAWRFVSASATNNIETNTLLVYLDVPGDFYLDDLSLVDGANAGVGPNLISQADFEVPALDTNAWQFGSNYATSALSTNIVHSGSNSLHVVCTVAGFSVNPLRVIQVVLPNPVTNQELVTLSFWYYTSLSASNLSLRLSPSVKISTNVQPAIVPDKYIPGHVIPAQVVVTPGGPNTSAATITPAIPPLWLNEVQPVNLTGITNRAGGHTPWIELYNAGSNSVSLNGFYLSDNYINLDSWAFPSGASIGPKEFKVIFCDGQTGLSSLSELHTSFLLNSRTGSVALSRLFQGQPQVLDFIDYFGVTPDRSYGDFPDGQPFTRQEFFYVTPGGANNGAIAPIQVFVNEWMSANTTTITDPADGNFDDWFELYNAGTNAANLAGYYLANNTTNKFLFQIPAGYVIAPQGFLLVWADKEAKQNNTNSADLHTNFRLSKNGASIGLYTHDGTTVDFLSYAAQTNDISSGRYPDGANNIVVLHPPTPRGPNSLPANTAPVLQPIADRTWNENTRLKFTALATDSDLPPQTLTFSLDPGAPPGAAISSAGLFQWRPSEFQGPGVYPITVRVTDNGIPKMSATRAFTVTVNEVNSPPWFADTREKYIRAGSFLSFTTALDSDWPAQNLSFTLDPGAPQGSSIDPSSGTFSWTPTSAQAPATYFVTVHATDDGLPPLSASATYIIHVLMSSDTLILVNVSRSANSIQLSWPSTIGSTYQAQFRDKLNTGNWTPLGGPLTAVSNTSTLTDTIGLTARYYRIVLVP